MMKDYLQILIQQKIIMIDFLENSDQIWSWNFTLKRQKSAIIINDNGAGLARSPSKLQVKSHHFLKNA